eukprot:Clim_evm84s236 gene=Clim_evmTU84s236
MGPSTGETATGTAGDRPLTILHFNDVYNITENTKDPCGGAARFVTVLRELQEYRPLTLFSGDAFNPSIMSTVYKGKQMSECLNFMGISCACIGNHDLDHGIDVLVDRIAETNFPWLCSNCMMKETGRPLADCGVYHITEHEGIRIGILGLIEKDWIDTLAVIESEDVEYEDFVKCGRRLARDLREREGCDLIVALTHMRQPNDLRLADEAPEIDIVLGGHDHHYHAEKRGNSWVLKSGTDFRDLSMIQATVKADNTVVWTEPKRFIIDTKIEPDPGVKEIVDEWNKELGARMKKQIAVLGAPLDGRFSTIRTKESNLGNLVADIMADATNADCAILNSGTLRSDQLHEEGPFRLQDLFSILPMPDAICVVELTGEQIVAALENSVSQWPKLEGRFAQVARLSFQFDPDREPGRRVLKDSVMICPRNTRSHDLAHDSVPIDMDATYSVAVKEYLLHGRDGYDMMAQGKVLVDESGAPVLPNAVRNFFQQLAFQRGAKKKCAMTPRRASRRGSLLSIVSSAGSQPQTPAGGSSVASTPMSSDPALHDGGQHATSPGAPGGAPKFRVPMPPMTVEVEGRIVNVRA